MNAETTKILLVEDDTFIADMIRKRLSEQGFPVLSAGNGEEALKLISAEASSISIILLDILLPEMNGFDILAHLKKILQPPAFRY